jgi:hypothetical protein
MGEEVRYILQGARNLRGKPRVLGNLNEGINARNLNMSN